MNLAEISLEHMAEAHDQLMAMQPPGTKIMGGFNFKKWLLKNGEAFGERVKLPGVKMRQIKECYKNSFQALMDGTVDRDEWFYTEGIVVTADLPIEIEHAWLSNRKGEVLDLTLREERLDGKPREQVGYYGIPFSFDYLLERTLKTGYYGILAGQYGYEPEVVDKPVTKGRAWKKGKR